MKYLFIFILLQISQNAFQQSPEIYLKESFPPENYIIISGETNVNQFELFQFFPGKSILAIGENEIHETPSKKKNKINIPLKDFTANNQLIYRDFLELLKAKEHPEVHIGISENEILNLFRYQNFSKPNLEITVAGVCKNYTVPCKINEISKNQIFLTGSQKILLTDFEIDPPVKTMGLIKVENEVIITFGLFFSLLNE
jgi:hypothetical protein